MGAHAERLTHAQIADRLAITPETASVHDSAILAKIGAADRTAAATPRGSARLPEG